MIVSLVCGQPDGKFFPGLGTFPLIGRPMMNYPLLAAQNARQVQKVFLSTSAPSMERIARHLNVTTLNRPPELSAPNSPLESIIIHSYRQILEQVDEPIEAFVVLLCNAPTVTADMIDKGVEMLLCDQKCDAVVSVSAHQEFNPRYALRINGSNQLEPLAIDIQREDSVFFPDALVWVLRPQSYFASEIDRNWLMDFSTRNAAPLVHEGYGDVDYPWQVPAIEDWLRRRGFTEERTPYDMTPATTAPRKVPAEQTSFSNPIERRILITTVPFGEPDSRPVDMLKEIGAEFVINPIGRRLKELELAELAADYGILIAGTEPITARVMDAAPHLKLIARVGIGLDNVDLNAARERGISVTYTPDAPSPAVAELAISLMLNLLRQVPAADRGIRNGVWQRFMGRRLDGQTVGIIGVGRIGKRVAKILHEGFPNVRLLANDLEPDVNFGYECNIKWVDKETLYRQSDIITLHLPRTPLTGKLIATHELDLMKDSVLLVNTSRGGMIDEEVLADALRNGRIGGAAIDVFGNEPYSGELATIDRCILTCHMGSMSTDCRARMELEATEEVLRLLRNEPLLRPVPEFEYELACA
jgi:D-3-phosphoglycerate dehydrogenase